MHPDQLRTIAEARIAEALGRAPSGRPNPLVSRPASHGAHVALLVLRRAMAVVATAIVTAWRANARWHQALCRARCPWEYEGPLRWQGSGRRARLVGSHLPPERLPS